MIDIYKNDKVISLASIQNIWGSHQRDLRCYSQLHNFFNKVKQQRDDESAYEMGESFGFIETARKTSIPNIQMYPNK